MFRLLALTLACGLPALPALAETRQVDLSVPGMFCASCPYIIRSAIGAVDGVDSVTADAEARTVTVIFDDAVVQLSEILDATGNAGYPATLLPEGS